MCFYPSANTTGPATTAQDRAQRGWNLLGNIIQAGQGNQAAKQRLTALRASRGAVMPAQVGATGGQASMTGA